MNKFILNLFGFLKSTTQFIKIILLFGIIILLMYWVESIANYNWDWLDFYRPFLVSLVALGKYILAESAEIFGAKFEYKYALAIILLLAVYFLDHLAFIVLEILENTYKKGRLMVRKIEENTFNKQLKNQQITEQTKLNNYRIFITTKIKKKFSHKTLGINLEEQNKIMHKFLIEKTGVQPKIYEGGYLYEFHNFNRLDSILQFFFKLLKADTPIDYQICVQITGENAFKEDEELKYIINLEFWNKISTLASTVYRYKFNEFHTYGTTQLGIFQHKNNTFEVFCFEEI